MSNVGCRAASGKEGQRKVIRFVGERIATRAKAWAAPDRFSYFNFAGIYPIPFVLVKKKEQSFIKAQFGPGTGSPDPQPEYCDRSLPAAGS